MIWRPGSLSPKRVTTARDRKFLKDSRWAFFEDNSLGRSRIWASPEGKDNSINNRIWSKQKGMFVMKCLKVSSEGRGE